MSKKLSDAALRLALLIDERTTRDADGTLTRYWIPTVDGTLLHATGEWVVVSGGGDAAILTMLHRAGFIAQTRHMRDEVHKYCYYSTEEVGRLREREWERIDRLKEAHEKEVRRRLAQQEAEDNDA